MKRHSIAVPACLAVLACCDMLEPDQAQAVPTTYDKDVMVSVFGECIGTAGDRVIYLDDAIKDCLDVATRLGRTDDAQACDGESLPPINQPTDAKGGVGNGAFSRAEGPAVVPFYTKTAKRKSERTIFLWLQAEDQSPRR